MINKRALYYKIPLWTLAFLGMLYIVVNTPLRQYLPGYLDAAKRSVLEESSMRIDSLEEASRVRGIYLDNLISILSDKNVKNLVTPFDSSATLIKDTLRLSSEREHNFVARYEEQERFGLNAIVDEQANKPTLFLNPIKGTLLAPEEASQISAGVNVKVARELPVLAPLEGVVVAVTLVAGRGYQVVMQHSNDYLTIFSQLSACFVEAGQTLKAGRVIGHIGGKNNSSSDILHVEVWHKGAAVDPTLVMEFE